MYSAQPKPISFFTHMGGVGKTTSLHNIACVLAKEFKLRALLIDYDSKCSLRKESKFHALLTGNAVPEPEKIKKGQYGLKIRKTESTKIHLSKNNLKKNNKVHMNLMGHNWMRR